jgi:Fic family protein
MKLSTCLKEEKDGKRKGGLYHKTQVHLAYNSNRIEGSKLTEEQTRYIFETRTIGFKDQEAVPVDDIIETSNHFVAFDYLLDTIEKPFTDNLIKEFHRILKSGTSDSRKEWFKVGDYKTRSNVFGDQETTAPAKVKEAVAALLDSYHKKTVDFAALVDFHYRFEKIHPFQDGNGRVGRIILFKECLAHNIVSFIIEDEYKMFYYRGLREFEKTSGYLMDTCLSAQDKYKGLLEYFS